MKTLANIIIINSQNVESKHMLAVIITSIFKEESSFSIWTGYTESDELHIMVTEGVAEEWLE